MSYNTVLSTSFLFFVCVFVFFFFFFFFFALLYCLTLYLEEESLQNFVMI